MGLRLRSSDEVAFETYIQDLSAATINISKNSVDRCVQHTVNTELQP